MAEESASVDSAPLGRVWIKRARIVMAAVMVALGAAIVPEGMRLGFMTASRDGSTAPGSGFFPVLVGALLVASAIPWGIMEWRTPTEKQIKQDIDPKGYLRVVNIAAACIGLSLLFVPLGFTLSVMVFLLYTTFTMRPSSVTRRSWVNVAVSLVTSVGLMLAFERGLGVTLPDSIIPFLAQLGL